ncbi:hypothetical protein EBR66_08580, partial [bacterium]|nr:hypothetical protein [bacterium]
MGLDTTHGCWHGAYSSFNTFRNRVSLLTLKKQLSNFVGFEGAEPFPQKSRKPIVILLNHSDCDGEIEWEDCLPLKQALEQMLEDLTDERFAEVIALDTGLSVSSLKANSMETLKSYQKTFVEKVRNWIEGLDAAHKAKENVGF